MPFFSRRLHRRSAAATRISNAARASLESLESRMFLSTATWTNASGGSFNTASNWSTNSVPGSNDDVFITLNGTYQVTLSSSVSLKSLTLGASTGTQLLAVSSSSVTLGNASSIGAHGVLQL